MGVHSNVGIQECLFETKAMMVTSKEKEGMESAKKAPTVVVSSFVPCKETQDKIIELRKSEDDPPIVFGWLDANLQAFRDKAVAYGATLNAIPPPAAVNGGAHLVGVSSRSDLDDLKEWILDHVRKQVVPAPSMVGAAASLACTQSQFGQVPAVLALLKHDPWFSTVLAHGNQLPGPLSTVCFLVLVPL